MPIKNSFHCLNCSTNDSNFSEKDLNGYRRDIYSRIQTTSVFFLVHLVKCLHTLQQSVQTMARGPNSAREKNIDDPPVEFTRLNFICNVLSF